MSVDIIGMAAEYLSVSDKGTEYRLRVEKPLRGVTALSGSLVEVVGTQRRETPFLIQIAGYAQEPAYPENRAVSIASPGGGASLSWPDKDNDDILDFGFEVGGFADDDRILVSEAVVLSGGVSILSHDQVPNSLRTVTRLAGGGGGPLASVRIRTYMSSGQRVDQTINQRLFER